MTEALAVFDALPWKERWFVRGRLASAPLAELSRRAPGGKVLDVGCGHGLLTALLAQGGERRVLGVDPDPRKISWAQAGPGRLPNVELRGCTHAELLPDLEGAFDAVVVADVLYLLPLEAWQPFLVAARRLLAPHGVLLLKEAEADRSWRYWKCLLQEQLMVRLARRTHSSGGLGFQPRAVMLEELARAGLEPADVVPLARGYSTPHVLYVARRDRSSAP